MIGAMIEENVKPNEAKLELGKILSIKEVRQR